MEERGQPRVLDAAQGHVLLRRRGHRRCDTREQPVVGQMKELGHELNDERRANGGRLARALALDAARRGQQRRKRLLAKDLDKVVQHIGLVEALDEYQEWNGGHAPVQRVVEAHLAQELHHEQRVAQPEALVLGEGEEEVEVGVVVPVQCRLLDEWLEQHAHGDVRLPLQGVLHVACQKGAQGGLVMILDEREGEHVEQVRRARVPFGGELVEQPEERHVRAKLQL